MPTVPVQMRSESASESQNIIVNPSGVRIDPGDTIKFKNFMEQDATIEFYALDAKGEVGATPISGFCNGMGDMLVVPKKNGQPGTEDCETTMTGDYAYSVRADDHNYLDPVIIIDPYQDMDFSFSDLPTSTIIGFVVLLGAVAALAYYLGFARGKAG